MTRKRKILPVILSMAISTVGIFGIIYFFPTPLTPPTRLGGIYNQIVGIRGFGFFEILVNDHKAKEKETIYLYLKNKIAVSIQVNDVHFENIDVKVYIDDNPIATLPYQAPEYMRRPKQFIIAGSPKYDGNELKIVLTGYVNQDLFRFKKGMKFQTIQTNIIIYKESPDY